MDISYVFKLMESSSVLTKQKPTPFRLAAIGLEENGCKNVKDTHTEDLETFGSPLPVVAVTDIMECVTTLESTQIVAEKLNKDVSLGIDHGKNGKYDVVLFYEENSSPVYLRMKGKEVVAKVLAYGSYDVDFTLLYRGCLACRFKVNIVAPVPQGAWSDVDMDGVIDAVDTNGDGKPDVWDKNGDGKADAVDTDGDGKPDWFDTDGDGIIDAVDIDGDGRPELYDLNGDCAFDAWDSNKDGKPDAFDTDGDGIIDRADDPGLIGEPLPKVPNSKRKIKGVVGGGGLCSNISGLGGGYVTGGLSPGGYIGGIGGLGGGFYGGYGGIGVGGGTGGFYGGGYIGGFGGFYGGGGYGGFYGGAYGGTGGWGIGSPGGWGTPIGRGWDRNGDGFADMWDKFGTGKPSKGDDNFDGKADWWDTNGDGIVDMWDLNFDGIPDAWDTNGDGKPDVFDTDGDGKPDWWDTDGDGKPDSIHPPDDYRGGEIEPGVWDTSGDGIPDMWDLDGDGKPDAWSTTKSGTPNRWDLDGDGKPDAFDINYDGVPDRFDTDGDGTLDMQDTDGDGVPDEIYPLPEEEEEEENPDDWKTYTDRNTKCGRTISASEGGDFQEFKLAIGKGDAGKGFKIYVNTYIVPDSVQIVDADDELIAHTGGAIGGMFSLRFISPMEESKFPLRIKFNDGEAFAPGTIFEFMISCDPSAERETDRRGRVYTKERYPMANDRLY